MGFRMRKSIKSTPGVRMNFSKSGIGYSVGTKGYRVTKAADGRVMCTTSIPGTGLSHVTTTGNGGATRRRPAPPPAWFAPIPKPAKTGLPLRRPRKSCTRPSKRRTSTRWSASGMTTRRMRWRRTRWPGSYSSAPVKRTTRGNSSPASSRTGKNPGAELFISKYVAARFTLQVVEGATAELSLDRSAVGLALAELHQEAGDIERRSMSWSSSNRPASRPFLSLSCTPKPVVSTRW